MSHHKIIWEEKIKMGKCKKCHCDCHCKDDLHAHHYDGDLCTCDKCSCKEPEGLVIDDTNECESCQWVSSLV